MIFVDSGVWIDFFRGVASAETDRMVDALTDGDVCTGDLVVTEVLQGFNEQRMFETAWRLMDSVPILIVGGRTAAYDAAASYRYLRTRGITVRKTIDVLIATRCILSNHTLLYTDRDFDPFVEHLGLRSAMA